MSVTYDSAGAGNSIGSSVTTTISWSHTISASDANTYVMTSAVFWYMGTYTSLVATYGGNAMTLVQELAVSASGFRIATFKYLTPPTGAQTVVITGADTGSGTRYIGGNSVAYQGVSGVVTGGTNTGTSGTASITAASAAGEMVLASLAHNNVLSSPSHTLRYNDTAGTTLLMEDTPGTGSNITFTATATSAEWGAVAARLQPIAGATNTTGFFGLLA